VWVLVPLLAPAALPPRQGPSLAFWSQVRPVAPPARLSPAIARAARLVRTDIRVSLDDEEEPREQRHLFDLSTNYTYAKERVFKAVGRTDGSMAVWK